jgi:hypothetical protein
MWNWAATTQPIHSNPRKDAMEQDEIHVLRTSELDELAQYRTKETKEQPK